MNRDKATLVACELPPLSPLLLTSTLVLCGLTVQVFNKFSASKKYSYFSKNKLLFFYDVLSNFYDFYMLLEQNLHLTLNLIPCL